ncbi:hypothetical protein [Paenibacillus sp. N3.4]|uniref:hypothetical protein n=1 Tax=Paenibacillus sp. N3.4 TaxID=2603222 RepID=UPI0011CAC118|nr:hypothetical protein [Paenibacillus sp. N3.4]TXK73831.1 hypothetical protein FU659_30320 [Paenibacillus sp. N3.4]
MQAKALFWSSGLQEAIHYLKQLTNEQRQNYLNDSNNLLTLSINQYELRALKQTFSNSQALDGTGPGWWF